MTEDMRAIHRAVAWYAYRQRGGMVPYDYGNDQLLFAAIIDYLNAVECSSSVVSQFMQDWKGKSLLEHRRPGVMEYRRNLRKEQWARWKQEWE